ncbi:DUF2637 domain-containing protein [Actinokineospora sp. HUAS TT18]|uniref:DUF2637 domain-containing protein n=1 Tax=Actinokineospora sp. HUAS TT18 TaxID=3447451 RepID=UPI003F527EF6
MTATNGHLAAQIREALNTARDSGQPTPGRPTLVRLTGATDHAVRKALAELARTPTTPGDVGEPASPAPDQPPATSPAAGARFVAWAGFVFGSIMSVAANVLHTWLPANTHDTTWSPGIAPQIGAAVWPIGLLVSVEVLSRVIWPTGWQWNLARFGGTGTVALGSAVISYGHLRDLLTAWHYDTLAAAVGPLVLDGLMIISGFALLAMSDRREQA